MTGTKFREKTLKLLRDRPASMNLKEVAEGSGLNEAWIRSFHQGKVNNPSVVFIEILYEFLAKKSLKI